MQAFPPPQSPHHPPPTSTRVSAQNNPAFYSTRLLQFKINWQIFKEIICSGVSEILPFGQFKPNCDIKTIQPRIDLLSADISNGTKVSGYQHFLLNVSFCLSKTTFEPHIDDLRSQTILEKVVSQPCHHDHHDLLHVPHQRRVQGGDGGGGGGWYCQEQPTKQIIIMINV